MSETIVREKSAYDALFDSPLREPFKQVLDALECVDSQNEWEVGRFTDEALSFFRKLQLGCSAETW
jgi:hypothetical protein